MSHESGLRPPQVSLDFITNIHTKGVCQVRTDQVRTDRAGGMADAKSARRFFVPPQDEFDLEGENFTVITSASQASAVDLEDLTVANVEGGVAIEIPVSYAELQNATEFEVQHYSEDPADDPDDPDYNPNTDGI